MFKSTSEILSLWYLFVFVLDLDRLNCLELLRLAFGPHLPNDIEELRFRQVSTVFDVLRLLPVTKRLLTKTSIN